MRLKIEIDDELLAEAMRATGIEDKQALVEEALSSLVRQHRQRTAIKNVSGLGWEGDLDVMRQTRDFR